jgi:hypothetical protein
VLEDAVKPDSFEPNGSRRPETILVITDGEPSDKAEVEKVIINATKKYMQRDEDLSITFIQIGNDVAATAWLTGALYQFVSIFFDRRNASKCVARLSYRGLACLSHLPMWLKCRPLTHPELDDGLQARGARFDCVDTLTWADAEGTSFDDLIRLSIND